MDFLECDFETRISEATAARAVLVQQVRDAERRSAAASRRRGDENAADAKRRSPPEVAAVASPSQLLLCDGSPSAVDCGLINRRDELVNDLLFLARMRSAYAAALSAASQSTLDDRHEFAAQNRRFAEQHVSVPAHVEATASELEQELVRLECSLAHEEHRIVAEGVRHDAEMHHLKDVIAESQRRVADSERCMDRVVSASARGSSVFEPSLWRVL